MLFAFIVTLILSVHGLKDFEKDDSAFTFIYHDNQRLLLTIHNTSCYFFDVNFVLHEQLDSPDMRDALEDQAKQAILEQDGGIRATTLTAMRDRYEDRLADFHCLDKDIFTIDMQPPVLSTTEGPCEDALQPPLTCAELDIALGGTVCRDQDTLAACPVYCRQCASMTTPTVPPCEDALKPPTTCAELDIATGGTVCQDPDTLQACPVYCRQCVAAHHTTRPPSTPTTVTTTVSTTQEPTTPPSPSITSRSTTPTTPKPTTTQLTSPTTETPTTPTTTTSATPTTTSSTTVISTTWTTLPPTTTLQPFTDTCVDNIGNGMHCARVPHVCEDIYGKILCPRFCGQCTPSADVTTAPENTVSPGSCVDHVIGEYQCGQLPSACSDSLARLFCPRYCGDCSDPTTTLATTTASPSECIDHLIYGKQCHQIPGICSSIFGRVACSRSCRVCSGPTPAHQADVTAAPGSCVDYVGKGLSCHQLPGVCSDSSQIGPQLLCPRTCGVCQPATTTPLSPYACTDHLIYDFTCNQIPGVCTDKFSLVCRRFCALCASTDPAPQLQPRPSTSCYDRVGNGLQCQQLPGICSDLIGSSLFCPQSCNKCPEPTTTTTPTPVSNVAHNSSCVNDVDDAICGLPGFCDDPYGRGLCRETCGSCSSACRDTIDCRKLIGHNASYPDVQALCADPLRADLCEHTCGCPSLLHR